MIIEGLKLLLRATAGFHYAVVARGKGPGAALTLVESAETDPPAHPATPGVREVTPLSDDAEPPAQKWTRSRYQFDVFAPSEAEASAVIYKVCKPWVRDGSSGISGFAGTVNLTKIATLTCQPSGQPTTKVDELFVASAFIDVVFLEQG